MSTQWYVFVCVCLSACGSVDVSRENQGYPVGYLSNCPGSEKKSTIPKKLLNQLYFIVQGPSYLGMSRKRYNYASAAQGIASDPRVDFAKRTLIFASGFLDSTNFPIAWVVGMHYSNLGYNVLLLDTNRFTTMFYPVASRLMRPVGKRIAQVLAQLSTLGLDPKKTELLGLSLGAHTISYIAKNYRFYTGRNISRITALDPAGPCFRNLPADDRLDSSDADFVDVIHTNIDGYGMGTPMGHVNFYVNGGEFQPGDVEWIPCTIMCSHVRSLMIWLASLVHPESFIAMKCDSIQDARDGDCYDRIPLEVNVVGLDVNKNATGIFYLATRNSYPYFLGKNGLKREYEVWSSHALHYNKDDVVKF